MNKYNYYKTNTGYYYKCNDSESYYITHNMVKWNHTGERNEAGLKQHFKRHPKMGFKAVSLKYLKLNGIKV